MKKASFPSQLVITSLLMLGFYLTACHSSQAPEQSIAMDHVDLQPNKNADKKTTENPQLATYIRVLNQSHQIFQEAWSQVWNTRTDKVNSAFRVVRMGLETKYGDDGIPLANNLSNADCKSAHYEMKVIKNISPVSPKYEIDKINCTSNVHWPINTWQVTAPGKIVAEFYPRQNPPLP